MASSAPPAVEQRTPHRLALPAILIAQFVTPLSIAGVAVALPSISRDLGTNPLLLQGAVNAFNISFALCTLLWGALSDKVGHARTFTLGVALTLAGSVGSTLSPNLWVLDGFRVLAGIGAAAVITSATTLLSMSYTGARRAAAFAAFGTVNGLGLAAGPTLSGLALSVTDWRGVFGLHAVLLLVALIGCRFLPEPNKHAAPSTALTSQDEAPKSRGALLHPGYWAMVLLPVAGAIGFVTLLTYMPTALQAVRGMSAGTSGLMMLAMTVPVLFCPALVHRYLSRREGTSPAGTSIVALACLVIAPLGLLAFSEHTPIIVVLLLFVIAGLGFGLPLGIIDATALSYIPPARQGAAAGVLNLFRLGSEAVFVALYATAMTVLISATPGAEGRVEEIAAGQPGGADIYSAALHPVLAGIAGLCALLLVTFVILNRQANKLARTSTE